MSSTSKSLHTVRLSITRKQAEDYGLIATAYHEAAHAIVGLANFLEVCNASVLSPGNGDTSYYVYDSSDKELNKMFIMSDLKTIYAGLVGERMYYQDICGSAKFPMHLKAGSSYDTDVGSKLIRQNRIAAPGEATQRLKRELKSEIEKFLARHWKSVKLVAHAIYKKRKLNFAELRYILTRSEDKEYWKDKFRKIRLILGPGGAARQLPERTVKSLLLTK